VPTTLTLTTMSKRTHRKGVDEAKWAEVQVAVAETLGNMSDLETFGEENDDENIEAMRIAYEGIHPEVFSNREF